MRCDVLDLVLERLDERRATHRLRLDDLVVQQRLDVVHGGQDVRAGLAVRDDHELHLRTTKQQPRQTHNDQLPRTKVSSHSQRVNASASRENSKIGQLPISDEAMNALASVTLARGTN